MFFSRAVSEGNIDYETKHHPLAPVTLFPPLFPTEPAFILFGLAPHVNSLIFKNASFIPRLAVRSPSSILLRKTFQKAGYAIQRTEDDESWTILWGLPKVLTQIRHLAPYQRVNHFPSTYELGRKDRLAIHLRRASRRVGQSHFEFSPLTFILPRDSDILTTYLNSMLPPDPETQSYSEQDDVMDLGEEHDAILEKFPVRFIHKPLASARGIGVRMLNALELLDLGNEAERTFKNAKKCILQEYVASPLLVNGHKVDLRLYVSITSINPLRIYLFKDGLVRFASNPFRSPTESTSRQSKHTKSDKLNEDETSSSDSKFDGEDKQFSHLTNYSVNKARKDQWSLPGNEWMMPARPILFDLKSGTVVEDLPKGLRKYMKPSKRRRLEKKEASAMHKDEDNSSDLSNCVLIGDLDGDGTKWSFMQLLLYCFFVLKCNPFIVVHRIQDVLIKSILSSMPSFQRVSSYLHYDTPCSGTELFGVDILLDCNLRPYILEFNTSPSLQSTSPLDQRLKQAMLVDWLNMVGTPLMGSTARTERGRPSEIRTVESSDGGVEEQVENEINEDDQQVLTEYDTRISPINYTPPRWMSQAEWNSKVKYVVLDVQTENERQTLRSRVDSCRTQSATVPRELHLVGGEREKRGLRQFEATVYTHGSVLLPSHSAGTAEGGDRERQKTRNDVKVDDGGGSCGDVDERTGSGIGRKNRKKADRHLFKTTEVTAIENMTANIEQTRWNTRQRGMNMRSSMHGEGKTRKGSTSPLPQADGIPFFSFSREGRSCAGVSLVDERTLIRSFQSVLPREGEGSAVNPANSLFLFTETDAQTIISSESEFSRRGRFSRIFPTPFNCGLYGGVENGVEWMEFLQNRRNSQGVPFLSTHSRVTPPATSEVYSEPSRNDWLLWSWLRMRLMVTCLDGREAGKGEDGDKMRWSMESSGSLPTPNASPTPPICVVNAQTPSHLPLLGGTCNVGVRSSPSLMSTGEHNSESTSASHRTSSLLPSCSSCGCVHESDPIGLLSRLGGGLKNGNEETLFVPVWRRANENPSGKEPNTSAETRDVGMTRGASLSGLTVRSGTATRGQQMSPQRQNKTQLPRLSTSPISQSQVSPMMVSRSMVQTGTMHSSRLSSPVTLQTHSANSFVKMEREKREEIGRVMPNVIRRFFTRNGQYSHLPTSLLEHLQIVRPSSSNHSSSSLRCEEESSKPTPSSEWTESRQFWGSDGMEKKDGEEIGRKDVSFSSFVKVGLLGFSKHFMFSVSEQSLFEYPSTSLLSDADTIPFDMTAFCSFLDELNILSSSSSSSGGEGQFGRDGKTWMEHRSPGQNMSESWRKDERGTRLPELGSEKKRETGKVDGKEKTKEGKRRVRRKGRVTVNDVADVGVLVLPDYMERFHVSPLCGNRNSLHHEEMGRKDGEGKGEDGYENLVSQEEELKRRRVVFEAGMEFDVVSEEDVISRVERYHGNAETKRERKAMEREKEREQQRGGRRKHDDSDDDGGMLGP